jgi:hypothetical protein
MIIESEDRTLEYATTQNEPPPRGPITNEMRKIISAIRAGLITCSHCQDRAILLRARFGKSTPLCKRHAGGERIDRQIAEQRARVATMRPSNK